MGGGCGVGGGAMQHLIEGLIMGYLEQAMSNFPHSALIFHLIFNPCIICCTETIHTFGFPIHHNVDIMIKTKKNDHKNAELDLFCNLSIQDK